MSFKEFRPLDGVRVLDFSLYLPGPYCTSILAGFGAEVIKVEPPGGDPVRRRATMFGIVNRGKKSICVDLRDDAKRRALIALAAKSQVLVEGFRPGVLERAGLGPTGLLQLNPSLVIASISGFGWSGPYRERAAHDLNLLALSGYFSVPSQLKHRPSRPQVRLADLVAGQTAAIAISMALLHTKQTGRGCHVDASIFDAMVGWTAPTMLSADGEIDPVRLPHVMADSDMYLTADGAWLAFGTLEDKFWLNFVNAVAEVAPELADPRFATRIGRDRHKRALADLLEATLARHPLAFWTRRLQGVDTAVAPAYDTAEALSDAHLRARGFVREDAEGGPEVKFPVNFGGYSLPGLGPAPALGADNDLLNAHLATGQ
ncbi:MAG: CoA transferase [Burkholderiales bacterium]|nr:CoA transferase [Burkholderiales bacterium]